MARPMELVVFADDWGRHPSSAQHLVRELLRQDLVGGVVWVNTIGMRRPRLRWGDVKRGWEKLRGRSRGATPRRSGDDDYGGRLNVVSPRMYPGFRSGWQRRFNARAMRAAVGSAVSADDGIERVGLTTLPITADLVDQLPRVERWVYYCVDNFSVWPGVDHGVMAEMEPNLVRKVDAVVCASEVLQGRISLMLHHGRTEDAKSTGAQRQDAKTPKRQDVVLVTHGVEAQRWRTPDRSTEIPRLWPKQDQLIALFWGLVDKRLDTEWDRALCVSGGLHPVYAGPESDEPGELLELNPWRSRRRSMLGQISFSDLPALAAAADVLVMPYRDMPVTRAMQPLKLLEYLATYKPVVVRDLPATREWADCCDVVSTAEDFVRVCRERAEGGLPAEQKSARDRRLPGESWSEKAWQLYGVLRGE